MRVTIPPPERGTLEERNAKYLRGLDTRRPTAGMKGSDVRINAFPAYFHPDAGTADAAMIEKPIEGQAPQLKHPQASMRYGHPPVSKMLASKSSKHWVDKVQGKCQKELVC